MLVHTRVSGHVDVPIEQAWAFMRDIHTLPMWHVMVVEARDVAGTFDQVGSTGTLVLKAPDGLHDFHIEVTGVEPHRLVTHVGQQVDGPMRYTTTVHYVPAGLGFDWTWEQDTEIPSGQPGPLGNETFMARLMEQGIRQSAENNKLLLEALVPQPAGSRRVLSGGARRGVGPLAFPGDTPRERGNTMRPRHATISVLLSILLLGLTIPTASAGAVRTDFAGFAFPAGWPGTPTLCPAAYQFELYALGGTTIVPRCVIDEGTRTELGDGRIRIRDMQVYDALFVYPGDPPTLDLTRSGYQKVWVNANLDASLTGPAWGTWELFDFLGDAIFAGTYTATYDQGVETARSVGKGTGTFRREQVRSEVIVAQEGAYNCFGTFLDPGA